MDTPRTWEAELQNYFQKARSHETREASPSPFPGLKSGSMIIPRGDSRSSRELRLLYRDLE